MVAPTTSVKLSELAKSRPRDAHGHFIKSGTDPQKTVATKIITESPLPTIQNPPPLPTTPPLFPNNATTPKKTTPKKDPKDLDEPLVVINNPFHKLLHWLDDIRKKQTTTFDLKISVPLIALPIFLVVIGSAMQYMFTLGKQTAIDTTPSPTIQPTTSPKPIPISKVGIIKGTYTNVLADEVTPTITPIPTNTPNPPTPTHTPTPTLTPTPSPTSTPTPIPPSRFVLVDKDDRIFFLITPSSFSLNKYLNQRVLLTGMYDASKETITVKKSSDIEVLP